MEIVVVGVDGSETALEAARGAAELAQEVGAGLHLVMAIGHRHQKTVRGAGQEAWSVNSFTAAEEKLKDIAGKLSFSGRKTTSVFEGDPAKGLVSEAERLGADVIVVGNKRTHGTARVLGAVALEVVHHAPCAVYIVKTT